MRRPDRVDLQMTLLVAIWGTAFVSLKILGQELSPMAILWYRYMPFLLVMLPWLLINRLDRVRGLSAKEWGQYVLLGLLGVAGYHLPVNYGLQSTGHGDLTAATGAVLIATTPLFTVLWSALLGRERFTAKVLPGYLLALAGVALVVLYGRGETGSLNVSYKALILLLAPMLWSLYAILGKDAIARDGAMTMNALSMCIGTLLLAPFGLQVGLEPLRALSENAFHWMLYLSLAATLLGYAIWNDSLRHRTANQVTVFIYLIPVAATIAAVVLLDTPITVPFLVGAAMVLGGIILLNKARARTPAIRQA